MGKIDIKLIPLRCPDCGNDIQSDEDDVVHFCTNCGSGYEVVLGKFKKVNVFFAKPEKESAGKRLYYLPMWQILSRISVKKSHNVDVSQLPEEILTSERFVNLFSDLLNREKPIEKMVFFVPAFGVTNRYQLMDQPGFRFTIEPPELKRGSSEDMVGAEYSLEDAIELAKDMFLSIQYQTNRGLKGLTGEDITFDCKKARIVGVPFYEEKGMLVDGLKGYKIFKNALKNWEKIKSKLGKN